MKRSFAAYLTCALLAFAPPAVSAEESVSVMTRNLYLGADLAPILSAPTPGAFGQAVVAALTQIAANNFPQRAASLAREIADKRPHLVGLQEVFRLTLNGSTGAPPYRDYLADLLDALSEQGENYYVVARVQNLNVLIPIPGLGLVAATDHDVVLARADVPAWTVPLSGCQASFDGCNYDHVVTLNTAVGPITLERGFVVVDALVDGAKPVRLANTHLEIPELPPQFQAAQANQLIAHLNGLPDPGGPTVVVGDINSAPTDQTITIGGLAVVPPYAQLAAVLSDAWRLRPGRPAGFTCCELSNLSNPESMLFKRVDVVFTTDVPARVKANVLGVDQEDKTPLGLWPSDHAVVVAELKVRY